MTDGGLPLRDVTRHAQWQSAAPPQLKINCCHYAPRLLVILVYMQSDCRGLPADSGEATSNERPR